MNNALRVLLRLITLVLGISIVVVVFAGAAWYMWQDAQGRAPEVGITITVAKIERSALGLYLSFLGDAVTEPANPADPVAKTFVVESGEAVSTVAWRLEEMGLVKDSELFRRFVQYHGADGDIQVGVYGLDAGMTMEEIMLELQHGRLPTTTVTFPEGWRAEQMAEKLEQAGIVSAGEFMFAVQQGRSSYSFTTDRPPSSPASLEGFLFPDTYQFPEVTTPDRVLDIVLQNWDDKIPPSLRAKAAALDMSLYQVVILASIVEREAVIEEERPTIAGVYLNRLAKGMYLQSDPTVQYAKGYDPETTKWWNPMLQEEAITVISPFNTFLNPGLPPSPICNPGAASIRGVLEPDEHDYLFFYAKGDGSHAFAKTYEEHLLNEQLYGAE